MLIFGFKESGQAVVQFPVLVVAKQVMFITEILVKLHVQKNYAFFQTVEYMGLEASTRNNIFKVSQTYCKVKRSQVYNKWIFLLGGGRGRTTNHIKPNNKQTNPNKTNQKNPNKIALSTGIGFDMGTGGKHPGLKRAMQSY